MTSTPSPSSHFYNGISPADASLSVTAFISRMTSNISPWEYRPTLSPAAPARRKIRFSQLSHIVRFGAVISLIANSLPLGQVLPVTMYSPSFHLSSGGSREDSLYAYELFHFTTSISKAHVAVFVYIVFCHIKRKLLHLGRTQERIGLFPDLLTVYFKAQNAFVENFFERKDDRFELSLSKVYLLRNKIQKTRRRCLYPLALHLFPHHAAAFLPASRRIRKRSQQGRLHAMRSAGEYARNLCHKLRVAHRAARVLISSTPSDWASSRFPE